MNITVKCSRKLAQQVYHLNKRTLSRIVQLSLCNQRNNSNSAQTKSKDGDSKQKPKPGGSYTRVFGILAIAGAAGWAFRAYTTDGRNVTVKPGDFVRYALVRREEVSSTCSIFTLKPAGRTAIDVEEIHSSRAIASVQFKQPQLQIARSYTLLPPLVDQNPQELRFLIRKERNGEVSGYLHRLPLGAKIELRGPSLDYVLPEGVEKVIFLAGGTGVAPATQILSKLGTKADMHLLWASRRREDCEGGVSDTEAKQVASGWNLSGWWSPFGLPSSDLGIKPSNLSTQPNAIVAQLRELRGGDDKARVDYYVDEEGTFIRPTDVTTLVRRNSDGKADSTSAARLILVSGPEGFVNYWAGPKQWVGGREMQGALGGALSQLDLKGWKVVKL